MSQWIYKRTEIIAAQRNIKVQMCLGGTGFQSVSRNADGQVLLRVPDWHCLALWSVVLGQKETTVAFWVRLVPPLFPAEWKDPCLHCACPASKSACPEPTTCLTQQTVHRLCSQNTVAFLLNFLLESCLNCSICVCVCVYVCVFWYF